MTATVTPAELHTLMDKMLDRCRPDRYTPDDTGGAPWMAPIEAFVAATLGAMTPEEVHEFEVLCSATNGTGEAEEIANDTFAARIERAEAAEKLAAMMTDASADDLGELWGKP